MSRRTLQRAPNPHQAPPVSVATRRDLFGTMGAMLLLTAAEAGPAKAAELDGELLADCADFETINRAHVASGYDASLSDAHCAAVSATRYGLLDRITRAVPRTPEGLVAKVQAVRTALHTDVPEMLADTFLDCALPYHLLADSLCRDLLGRAGA